MGCAISLLDRFCCAVLVIRQIAHVQDVLDGIRTIRRANPSYLSHVFIHYTGRDFNEREQLLGPMGEEAEAGENITVEFGRPNWASLIPRISSLMPKEEEEEEEEEDRNIHCLFTGAPKPLQSLGTEIGKWNDLVFSGRQENEASYYWKLHKETWG
jgi:hypothetical protein